MSKHTPEPWRVLAEGHIVAAGNLDERGNGWSHYVADVYARDDEDAELQANATLIAAAPDLLEALRQMVEAWHEPLDDEPARVAAAEAAIAKAEGR